MRRVQHPVHHATHHEAHHAAHHETHQASHHTTRQSTHHTTTQHHTAVQHHDKVEISSEGRKLAAIHQQSNSSNSMRIEHDFTLYRTPPTPTWYGNITSQGGIRTYQYVGNNIGNSSTSISEKNSNKSVGVGNASVNKTGITIGVGKNASITLGGIANKNGQPIVTINTQTSSTWHSTTYDVNGKSVLNTVKQGVQAVGTGIAVAGGWAVQEGEQAYQFAEGWIGG